MFRARLVAVFIVVLLALGHVAAYQYFAEQVTETMRDQATGADQARSLRLHLQLFMLLDTALLVFLIGWVTVWNEGEPELLGLSMALVRTAMSLLISLG